MEGVDGGGTDARAARAAHGARWGPRLGAPRWGLVVAGYLLALGAGWGYGAAIRAAGDWDTGAAWERSMLLSLKANQPGWLDGFLYLIPWVGTNLTLGPVVAILAALLLWARRRDLAIWIGVVEAGVISLNWLVKHLLGRDRPELFERVGWFGWESYPSGHVMSALAVLTTLAALAHRANGVRWPYWVAAVTIALIAYSRLAHGVHWPTDIIGGAIVGAIWLIATWFACVGLPAAAAQRSAAPPSG